MMRKLWTSPDVSYEGVYHNFVDVSLSPLPIQRPIPLYFGLGRVIAPIPPDAVLKRIGRLADGWFPIFKPDADGQKAFDTMRAAALEAGRDPGAIVMEMTLNVTGLDKDQIRDEILKRRDFGVDVINFSLPGTTAAEHIDALKRLKETLDSAAD